MPVNYLPLAEGDSINAGALNTVLGALEDGIGTPGNPGIVAGDIKKNSLRAEQIPSILPETFGTPGNPRIEPLTGGRNGSATLTFVATGSANRQPVPGMTLTWDPPGFTLTTTEVYGPKAIMVLSNLDTDNIDTGGPRSDNLFYALEYDDGVSWNLINRTTRQSGNIRWNIPEFLEVPIRTLLTTADVTAIRALRLTCWVSDAGTVDIRDGNITALPMYCKVM